MSGTNEDVVLDCEVPTYKSFLLLVTGSRVGVDWFGEGKKKELQPLLDGFHRDIAGHTTLNQENFKANSAVLLQESKELGRKLVEWLKPLKTQEKKSDKEVKFIKFVEDHLVTGVATYAAKVRELTISRFTTPETVARRDTAKNSAPELKELENPFIDYCKRTKSFDFDRRRMKTDAHATAYSESFSKVVRKLTQSIDKLGRQNFAVSNEEVANKMQLMDRNYENFRSYVAENARTFLGADARMPTLKGEVEDYKNALRRLPLKMDD